MPSERTLCCNKERCTCVEDYIANDPVAQWKEGKRYYNGQTFEEYLLAMQRLILTQLKELRDDSHPHCKCNKSGP